MKSQFDRVFDNIPNRRKAVKQSKLRKNVVVSFRKAQQRKRRDFVDKKRAWSHHLYLHSSAAHLPSLQLISCNRFNIPIFHGFYSGVIYVDVDCSCSGLKFPPQDSCFSRHDSHYSPFLIRVEDLDVMKRIDPSNLSINVTEYSPSFVRLNSIFMYS